MLRTGAAFGLIVTVAAMAFVLTGGEGRSCAPGGGELSVYEWRASAWETPEAADDLLVAAEDLCLDTVYVDVTGLAVPEHADTVEASLRHLLDVSEDSPVQIGALAGDPWWASADGLSDASVVLDRLDEISTTAAEPIASVHLDVEPWGLDQWSEQKSELVTSFLDFVAEIVDVRDGLGDPSMRLSFLIPYWFDGSNGEAPSVSWNGTEDHPFQHLHRADLHDVDWIVMAYRDEAEGDNGVLALLTEELALSDAVGLALETAPIEPMSITFADESLEVFANELTVIEAAGLGLGEILINDFEHLRELADREPTPTG